MRRTSSSILIAAVVLFAAAASVLFIRNRETNRDFTKLKAANEETQSRYSQTLEAIASIQDSLNAISLGDTSVSMRGGSLQTEQSLNGPSGQEALDRIAVLRASISRSKQRIRQLENNLRLSGNKVAGLEKLVANLKQSVSEKEQVVAELSSKVENLSTQVAGLENTVQENQQTLQQREQAIEDKRRELATIYYVVGSKQTLTKEGAVVATGGVLGMGKTLLASSTVKDAALTPLDTDENTIVPTGSAKAKVISAQPASSYQLTPGTDGKMELHILDTKQFRQVKTLVIMTV